MGQGTPLGEAEQALQSIQFDRAREAAHRAVDSGGLDTKQLARAYEIIGLCAASVGSHSEAHAAYLRLLALAPGTRPSEMLPPEKNRPFYEAQGFWLSRPDRLGLSVETDPATHSVRVTLSDPLGMGQRIAYLEAGKTASGEVKFEELVEQPVAGTRAQFGSSLRTPTVLFAVELRDAHKNLLVRREGKLEPAPTVAKRPVAGPVIEQPAPPPPPVEPERRPAWVRSPWLWGAVGAVVVGGVVTTAVLLRNRDPELRTDITLAR